MRKGCVSAITWCSVIIFITSIIYYFFIWPSVQSKATSQLIIILDDALRRYRTDYPESKTLTNSTETINALLGTNSRNKIYLRKRSMLVKEGRLVDYWKRPIIFRKLNDRTRISSNGMNGLYGDQDDILPNFSVKNTRK
ncbi:MAG TPA: hypothetical protein EYG40_12180 [Verrucomicrobia bacterium]|nr:hypothetical protein [Verrucomicrobiales bacterium]HIL55778.1 hypothetical protein [Verrucomicrobiota bacterium]